MVVAQSCRFEGFVVSFLCPGAPFWHLAREFPGGPWEQQDGRVGVHNPNFNSFGAIWGPYSETFLGTESFKSMFFVELVSRTLFVIPDTWGLKDTFSLKEYCKTKTRYCINRCLTILRSISIVFRKLRVLFFR